MTLIPKHLDINGLLRKGITQCGALVAMFWGARYLITDGDLVNEDMPLAFGPAGQEGLAVWGPEVPGAFLE
ncbi:hypothetical protein LTR17_024063 [Elasticomyces elasticus]|nr:hypothetical protein LTR17_024063 [Elasticomyces elasticus]